MPVDAALTPARDIRIDPTGDIQTTAGSETTRLQHANAIFRAASTLEAQLLDVDAAEDLRISIQRELDALDVGSYTIQVAAQPPDTLEATVDSTALDEPVTEEVTQ